jgi:hypothetical protein
MSEIKITTEKVREAYKKGNDCVKSVLHNLFGEDVCAPKNVMDRVKTFEDACIETGTDIQAFNEMTKNLDEHVVTYMKLSIIVKALNEDDKFPYFTKDEWRYYPYFWLYTKDEYEKMNAKDREKISRVLFRSYLNAYSPGGVAYADAGSGASLANYGVGARLVFRNRELALYAGKQFIDLYVKHLFDADIVKD